MTNTPNTFRDNSEEDRQRTVQEYDHLRHALGLPQLDTLLTHGDRAIAQTIADQIARSRLGLRDINELVDEITEQLGAEATEGEEHNEGYYGLTNAPEVYAKANAILSVIYRNFDAQDIRDMYTELPNSIRTLNINQNDWVVNNVNINGVNSTVTVHLDNDAWSGSQAEIRNNILNQRPGDVGINIVPHIDRLDENAVNAIFASQADVVNTRLPLTSQRLEDGVPIVVVPFGIPEVNLRTFVDVPALIKENPGIANMDAATLSTYLDVTNPDLYRRCVRSYDLNQDRAMYSTPHNNLQIEEVVQAMFHEMKRNPNGPLCSQEMSLEEAITNREPLDRLMKSTADNRVLLLALASVQQDPRTLEALRTTDQVGPIDAQITSTNQLLQAATAVEAIESQEVVAFSQDEITAGQDAMNQVINNASVNIPGFINQGPNSNQGANSQAINLYPNANNINFTQLHREAALRAGVPQQKVLEFFYKNNGSLGPTNISSFEKVIDTAKDEKAKYLQEQSKINTCRQNLQTVITSFTQHGLTPANLPQPEFPQIYTYLVNQGAFDVNINNITNNTNFKALAGEIRNVLQNRVPEGSRLFSSQEYEIQLKELHERRRQAVNNPQQELTGEDAAWAVIERGMRNKGLSAKETEGTLEYMKAKVEETPESVREVEDLVDWEVQVYRGEDEDEVNEELEEGAVREWEKAQGIPWANAGDFWNAYQNRLFRRSAIGLRIDEPNLQDLPLPHIINSFFNLEYLYKLPDSDPRHIPKTPQIERLRHRLRMHILRRAKKTNFGASAGELAQVRSMLEGGDGERIEKLSYTERMQAMLNMLNDEEHLNDPVRKARMDSMIKRAHDPIKRRIEKRKGLLSHFNPFQKFAWNRPITYIPQGLVGNVLGKGVVANTAKVTYKVGKDAAQNTPGIVAGGAAAAVGGGWMAGASTVGAFLSGPVGWGVLAAGACAGWYLSHQAKKKQGAGSPPTMSA